ncbi:glucose-1-phosphate thymidylylransferase, long form [Caldisphaera lagunensis DSM 15908]|uniref:Glucose-1-phosphate thymidylylransferase, long form n=1 Tax=Caldisphaera lagunensis (strain DSM 15908 / JCM 11604 / ANMR 0165 / IC-154) TaxID=1056495 RepID=L0A9V3_CALLD|nr:glucose-1-phosphate thymidylyltransferase [Caldisphaera lagunensis]AFZ70673.1 glucose-1-phosphate thymidylylransferase, long form [Caldisphaera lagunensis DSM 15908]
MKGIILHGGKGTRLRPLTFSGPKQLIPIANKPISHHVLDDLLNAGIKDIAIVLGNTYPESVVNYYKDGKQFNANITYIYQGEALGIAHAVLMAEEFVNEEPFIVYLGDNLLQYGISKYRKEFEENDYDAMVLLKEVDDPRSFGVAIVKDNKIIDLIEKPKEFISKLALTGIYFLKPSIFNIIKGLKPSKRGELEITDALSTMLKKGYKLGFSIVDGWWLDTGKKDDIILANQLILDEKIQKKISNSAIITNSNIGGRVEIDEKTIIENSIIRGPLIIGKNSEIRNSFIGSYTSVGNNVKIVNSEIENSIILDNTIIENVKRIEDSLIGRNSKIKENSRKVIKLHVSDYSEIEL